jgi:hypothetical protein
MSDGQTVNRHPIDGQEACVPPIAAPGLGGGRVLARVLASHLISLLAVVFNRITLGANYASFDLSRPRDHRRH